MFKFITLHKITQLKTETFRFEDAIGKFEIEYGFH
jgi:hypothetical protein